MAMRIRRYDAERTQYGRSRSTLDATGCCDRASIRPLSSRRSTPRRTPPNLWGRRSAEGGIWTVPHIMSFPHRLWCIPPRNSKSATQSCVICIGTGCVSRYRQISRPPPPSSFAHPPPVWQQWLPPWIPCQFWWLFRLFLGSLKARARGGTHKIVKNILLTFLIFELGDPKIYMSIR